MRIGIDVGGTFTDVVAASGDEVIIEKAPTTPNDPSDGVLQALTQVAERRDESLNDLLAATDRIVHGTTVATNALLERKGARVGLLTTDGHRDVLEMREGLKADRYNLRLPPPIPLVPRHRRLGVRERIRADGSVDIALDPRSLDDAIATLRAQAVDAVAVCYLHSYRDPSHERATRDALARALPDAYISLSSDVLPQIKEYERVSTTVVNAYVGPVVAKYFARLESRLQNNGYQAQVLIERQHDQRRRAGPAARSTPCWR
ncbi:MAG: hydantoinase/oxoprolinase family protein [Pseudomonadota bacterium]